MLPFQRVIEAVSKYSDRCIVCLETAADFHGLSNGGNLTSIFKVYSPDNNIVENNIKVITLSDCFNLKRYDRLHDINVTTVEQTLLDLIDNSENVDPQNLLESLANYYYDNGNSFINLERVMTLNQLQTLRLWREDAVNYYEE